MHKYRKMCLPISCQDVVCTVEGRKVSAFLLRKIGKESRCLFVTTWCLLRFFMGSNLMVRLGRAYFKSKSGKAYNFLVYPWGTNFRKGLGAVYFVTTRYLKKDGIHVHGGIHVGQTGDLSTEFDYHPKQSCFAKYGANCVCVHEEADGDTRLHIVLDLVDSYDPPCNKK